MSDVNGLVVEEQARRLYVSKWLTHRATQVSGGTVAAGSTLEALAALARRIADALRDEVPADVRFEPRYPGPVEGELSEDEHGRLVLTCNAYHGASLLGVVYTVLIAGRRPEVSVAPKGAHVENDHTN